MKKHTAQLILLIAIMLIFFVGSTVAYYGLGWGGTAFIVISWIVGIILIGSVSETKEIQDENSD